MRKHKLFKTIVTTMTIAGVLFASYAATALAATVAKIQEPVENKQSEDIGFFGSIISELDNKASQNNMSTDEYVAFMFENRGVENVKDTANQNKSLSPNHVDTEFNTAVADELADKMPELYSILETKAEETGKTAENFIAEISETVKKSAESIINKEINFNMDNLNENENLEDVASQKNMSEEEYGQYLFDSMKGDLTSKISEQIGINEDDLQKYLTEGISAQFNEILAKFKTEAEKNGMTTEEYKAYLLKNADEKTLEIYRNFEAQAKENGMSVEEYVLKLLEGMVE